MRRFGVFGVVWASASCQALLLNEPSPPAAVVADGASQTDGGANETGVADSVTPFDVAPPDGAAACVGTFDGGVAFCDDFERTDLGVEWAYDNSLWNFAHVDTTIGRGGGRSLLAQFTRSDVGPCRSAQAKHLLAGGDFARTHVSFWVRLGGGDEFQDEFAVRQSIENGLGACGVLMAFRFDSVDNNYAIHLIDRRNSANDGELSVVGRVKVNTWTQVSSDFNHVTGEGKVFVGGSLGFDSALPDCDFAPGSATVSFGLSNCPAAGTPDTIRIHFDDVLAEAL